MTIGFAISALLLGIRHGFDWDHLAAIGDISATQETARRGAVMSTLYVLGHAGVVFAIGAVAVVTGRNLPGWADALMGVVVGWTLILLGAYVAYSLVRHRGRVPLRSRWMIVLAGLRRAYGWVRNRVARLKSEPVAHAHPHSALATFHHRGEDASPHGRLPQHTHFHVHDPAHEPFADYTPATSIGVGALHGIGAETPTQVLVFLAAANAGGTLAGLAVLGSFLVGLILANSVITFAATVGFFAAGRRRLAYNVLAGVTAVVSFTIGTLLVMGQDAWLPALLAG